MSCKNLTNWHDMQELVAFLMKDVQLATKLPVISWAVAKERLEILTEVRLIIVPGLLCKQPPIDGLCRRNHAEDMLQSEQPRQRFR